MGSMSRSVPLPSSAPDVRPGPLELEGELPPQDPWCVERSRRAIGARPRRWRGIPRHGRAPRAPGASRTGPRRTCRIELAAPPPRVRAHPTACRPHRPSLRGRRFLREVSSRSKEVASVPVVARRTWTAGRLQVRAAGDAAAHARRAQMSASDVSGRPCSRIRGVLRCVGLNLSPPHRGRLARLALSGAPAPSYADDAPAPSGARSRGAGGPHVGAGHPDEGLDARPRSIARRRRAGARWVDPVPRRNSTGRSAPTGEVSLTRRASTHDPRSRTIGTRPLWLRGRKTL